MATSLDFARWIVENADKKGTPEFATVAKAFEISKQAEYGTVAPIAPPPPTPTQQIIGAGEAALTTGTAALAGPVGGFVGGAMGVAKNILDGRFQTPDAQRLVEESVAKGAQAVTYQPRTQAGQEAVQTVVETVEAAKIPPFVPIAGPAGTVRPAVQATRTAAGAIAQPVREAVVTAVESIKEPRRTAGSVGAASTELGTLRQASADQLPIPIALTKGQRNRTFEQQRFEQEISKDPEKGASIRERLAEQQNQIKLNLEAFIDATGAETRDLRTAGTLVVEALRGELARDKTKVRTLYKAAENAGETQAPVNLAPLADYLNNNRAGRTSAPILNTIANELEVRNVGTGSLADGTLTAGEATLKTVEELRKSVNKFVKSNDPNDVRVGIEIKDVIDGITENAGGELYQRARRERQNLANRFENVALVSNLINTKRNSNDRIIAYEDVIRKAVLEPSTSLDSTKHLFGLLKKSPEGRQAVKEIQGAVLQAIRDDAYKNVTTNERGDRLISPAAFNRTVQNLDKSGKLAYVFGKKGAEQIRTLNDVVSVLFTAPPGTVNTSNTASVLLTALDTMTTYGTTGIPVPAVQALRAAAKQIKDRKVRKQVEEALRKG